MILYDSRNSNKLFGDSVIITLTRNKRNKWGYEYLLGFKKLDGRIRSRWYYVFLIWYRINIAVNKQR